MKVSVKHALFSPVYERAMPAIGPFRCLRRLRILPPPIAGMAGSNTNSEGPFFAALCAFAVKNRG